MAKRILITNNHFREIKGSELVTLELAEEFLMRGYEVVIYTNLYGYPLSDEIEKLYTINADKNLRVVADPYENIESNFDILWIHHNLLPPSIIRKLYEKGIDANIVWHHMSPIIHIEMPLLTNIENNISDTITVISPEVQNLLIDFGIIKNKISLFSNPAPDIFSNYTFTQNTTDIPEKILIVSNHPPLEILEASKLLRSKNIIVDLLGDFTNVSRVTPDLLADYNAIITIGKTVQYANCMGIPVYEYDHFGGNGWLNESNYEIESQYNFSGRSTLTKKTTIQIVGEVMSGYKTALNFARKNRSKFAQQYSLSKKIGQIIDNLPKKPTLKKLTKQEMLLFDNFDELHRGLYRTLMYYKDNHIK